MLNLARYQGVDFVMTGLVANDRFYIPNVSMCALLDLSLQAPFVAQLRFPERLHGSLTVSQIYSKEEIQQFLRQNKSELSLQRIRDDLAFWDAHDFAFFAMRSNSPKAAPVQELIMELWAQEMYKNAVPLDQVQAIVAEAVLFAQMEERAVVTATMDAKYIPRLEALEATALEHERELGFARPAMKVVASAAGVALEAQKRIKDSYKN